MVDFTTDMHRESFHYKIIVKEICKNCKNFNKDNQKKIFEFARLKRIQQWSKH